MKKISLFTLMLSLGVSACWAGVDSSISNASAALKAPASYTDEVITEAPAGELVRGIRSSYSCYYQSGNHYREFEDGVVGEYVLGTDGCIYLRAVDYAAAKIGVSTNLNTYLKLEKVDDTTYVAHTPQLIWVDTTGDSPFTAYATRCGFSKKSASSFGYEIETDKDGNYITDVYFTYKDGVLMQNSQETEDMNGELFPKELIGFTSAAGNWIGFGGGCINISQSTTTPTTLPADAQVEEKTLDFDILHVRDKVIDNAAPIKYAKVGDEIYITNPSSGTEQWIKGTINADDNTVTFVPQYLGVDEVNGYAVWFTPATYDKYLEILNEEDGTGDWLRTYAAADKAVFKMEDGKLIPTEGNQALFFSHSFTELLQTGVYANPSVVGYSSEMQTPASVIVTKFEPYDDMWGFGVVGFGIPCRSVDGSYISPDELFFNFYVDDSTEPYLFSTDTYMDMVEDMTNVPYNYSEDFDFKANGVNHTVYFYGEWQKVGIQVLHVRDGETTKSDIVYAGNTTNGVINMTVAPKEDTVKKYVKDGELRIVRNGVEYNVLGISVK